MSLDNLPVEWFETTLDQIAEWGSGGTPSRKNSTYYGGDVPWIKTGDLGEKYVTQATEFITDEAVKNSSAKYFKKGSVIMAMYGATIGKTSILGIDATTNQACAVGTPIATSTEFLYYFLRNEKDAFIAKGKGGAQPNISQQIIKAHTVYLPALAEQQEIVRQLGIMLAQVEQIKARLDAIPAILKKFRQSVLADAVSGKLTEEWREKNSPVGISGEIYDKIIKERQSLLGVKYNKKVTKLNDIPAIGIPQEWLWTSIDSVCLKITDGTHHSPKSFPTGEYMYVTSKNIREGYIKLDDISYVDSQTHKEIYSRCDVKLGDVLYVKDGANTGLACVNNIAEEISLLSSVGVLKVSSLVNAMYLQHYLNSPIGRKLMLDLMGGTAIKRLTLSKIMMSPITLPPIDEQYVIVEKVKLYMGLVSKIEETVQSAQKRVNLLTQSILAKAFSGELTAEWREQHQELITGINSAESLLAKIQAERDASKPVKKTRAKKEA